tara:strand:- start:79345 stop:80616 length:1272 start_codon:yes stop_codon:yes gene_type:complete
LNQLTLNAIASKNDAIKRKLNKILLFLGLFSLFTRLDFQLGDMLIPNPIGFLCSIFLIAFNYELVKKNELSYIIILFLFSLLGIVFTPMISDFYIQRLLASIQFLYSLICGYGMYVGLKTYNRTTLRKLFLSLYVFITVGAILEIISPLKIVVTAYSNVYIDPITEADTIRDIALSGFYRPKFFTSEVSHISLSLVIFILIAYLNDKNSKLSFYTGLIIIAMVIFRSPIFLLGMFLLFSTFYYFNENRNSNIRLLITLFSFFVFILFLIISINIIYADRIYAIQSGSDFSTTIRIFAGILVGVNVASIYPIWGVGIGGTGAAEEIIKNVFIDNNVPTFLVYTVWDRMLNNGLGVLLLSYGYIGSILYIYLWKNKIKLIAGGGQLFVGLCILLISQVIGNIYSPLFISLIYIISLATKKRLLEK